MQLTSELKPKVKNSFKTHNTKTVYPTEPKLAQWTPKQLSRRPPVSDQLWLAAFIGIAKGPEFSDFSVTPAPSAD